MKARLALLVLIPLLALGWLLVPLLYMAHVLNKPSKALNIALLIDQSVNVSLNGRVDQSISYRAAVANQAGRRWGCVLCKLLDAVVANHCVDAFKAGK